MTNLLSNDDEAKSLRDIYDESEIADGWLMRAVHEAAEADRARGYTPPEISEKSRTVRRLVNAISNYLFASDTIMNNPDQVDIAGGTGQRTVNEETDTYNPFPHEFWIRDVEPLWIIEKLDDKPVHLEFQSCKEAIDTVLVYYRDGGLIK